MEKREEDFKEIESKLNEVHKNELQPNKDRPFIHQLISKFPSLYIILKNKNDIKSVFTNIKGYNVIKKNNLVDISYYLKDNGDIKESGIDPLIHYIYYGFKEGRNPNSEFDGDYYLKKYEDVQKSNLNPLVHYSLYGIYEGRKTQKSQEDLENRLKILESELYQEKAKLMDTENKLKVLEEEKTKLSTMPTYENLRRSIKGRNSYLFLINDSNQEIRQHFDGLHNNNFNASHFIKSLNFKKKFCSEKNIKHFFFIVPDKSLVCKDFLPFEIKLIKRNYDLISNVVPDFVEKLDHNCYFKIDSHINYFGGKELAYNYLHYIDNGFKRKDFNKLIKDQTLVLDRLRICDLTMSKNWSYSEEEKEEYPNKEIKYFKNKFLINLKENIPENFKTVGIRETEYYENPHGLTDLRVLIFRDSSLELLRDVLSMYFKDILLYWDHWFFNEELIEWYKPDIILEIRTERFLENMKYEFI